MYSSIGLVLPRINLEIIFKKLLDLLNLAKAQAFNIYKSIKIVIIGWNKNFVFITFLIVVPGLESFNNKQKFCIISFILSFGKNHFFKKMLLAKIELGHIFWSYLINTQLTKHFAYNIA